MTFFLLLHVVIAEWNLGREKKRIIMMIFIQLREFSKSNLEQRVSEWRIEQMYKESAFILLYDNNLILKSYKTKKVFFFC